VLHPRDLPGDLLGISEEACREEKKSASNARGIGPRPRDACRNMARRQDRVFFFFLLDEAEPRSNNGCLPVRLFSAAKLMPQKSTYVSIPKAAQRPLNHFIKVIKRLGAIEAPTPAREKTQPAVCIAKSVGLLPLKIFS